MGESLLLDYREGGKDASFDFIGYGMIDYHSELWLHGELGHGAFGVVRRATLRRRGTKPACYVAVKELIGHDPDRPGEPP